MPGAQPGRPPHGDDHRTATSAEGWLIGERPLAKKEDSDGETKYYFSNLPAETTLEELAVAVRSRWPIEQFYEDGKQLCGLGDYGRSDTICGAGAGTACTATSRW